LQRIVKAKSTMKGATRAERTLLLALLRLLENIID